MKNKNIALLMRNLRQKKSSQTNSSVTPQAMVESIYQSMRVEGYDISKEDVHKAIQNTQLRGAKLIEHMKTNSGTVKMTTDEIIQLTRGE